MPPYPQHWPKPNKLRPNTVASKVTDEIKTALFQRNLTTRQLAKELNVSEKYLSGLFPGKDSVLCLCQASLLFLFPVSSHDRRSS